MPLGPALIVLLCGLMIGWLIAQWIELNYKNDQYTTLQLARSNSKIAQVLLDYERDERHALIKEHEALTTKYEQLMVAFQQQADDLATCEQAAELRRF